ncbi:hypothetical protein I4U23_021372 [Adineta vaga]|nr:hypothetical protein I4U23_021372 [Adineta vaga]
MNSPIFTILVLIIGVVFFQPTHQYRLSKRELTEYDLTNFIVGTCSAEKTNQLIQDLCDQTLRSALMGTFPFLTYYCQTIGAGMRYCSDVNGQLAITQNAGAKRFIYRRLARSLHEDERVHLQDEDMNTETDLEQKLIMQMCIIKTGKNSVDTNHFCERKVSQIQKGQYPEIENLCKSYPDFAYCQQIQSHLLSTDSIPPLPNSSVAE